MANVTIGARVDVKKLFFDRAVVEQAVDRAEKATLSKAGAHVRTSARRSMRPGGKKGRVSRPGEPPRYHTKLLRDGIFFAFEPSNRSVVIGPVLINRSSGANEVLEFGGTSQVKTGDGQTVTAHIGPRPYMGPALEKEAENFPKLFTGSVHR